MKSLRMLGRRSAFSISILGAALVLSCAHSGVQKASLPPNADPKVELDKVQDRFQADHQEQMDVVAPSYFQKAESSIKDAKDYVAKGKMDKAKDSVEWANGYLNSAEAVNVKSANILDPVLEARQAAVDARANTIQQKEFEKTDRKLKEVTGSFTPTDIPYAGKDLAQIQSEYLNHELNAIKAVKLGEARKYFKAAENEGAKKYAPKTYAETQAVMANAEKSIEMDRDNTALVDDIATTATYQARKLNDITRISKNSRKGASEATAIALYDRSTRLRQTQNELYERDAEYEFQTNRMGAAISDLKSQNRKLATEQEYNEAIEKARKQFKPNEADIFRQGDDVVVRLKGMSFQPAKSSIPKPAMNSLKKVKEVISELDAEKVTVQGFADSTGTEEVNKRVSQARAETVKDHLVSEGAMASSRIDAVGQGEDSSFSNKTSKGRAENRRVDIIITPGTVQ